MYVCMYVCVAEFSRGEFYAVCAHSEPLSLSAGPVLPLQGARPACHGTVIYCIRVCIMQCYFTLCNTYIHTYIHAYMDFYPFKYTCIHTHIHTYILTYIHTNILLNRSWRFWSWKAMARRTQASKFTVTENQVTPSFIVSDVL